MAEKAGGTGNRVALALLSSDEEDDDDESIYPAAKKPRRSMDVTMTEADESALWGDMSEQDDLMVHTPLPTLSIPSALTISGSCS